MIIKDTIIEIKKTYKRFLSLLLIAFLGVGFFAGIRATSPDMEATLNNYYQKNNVYDIKVISTMGLNNDDIQALKAIKGLDQVVGSYSLDALVNYNKVESVSRIISIEDKVNGIKLIKGHLPKSNTECVVDGLMLELYNLKIGDKIKVKSADLNNKNLKIVGIVNSSLYISNVRGTSRLGSGKVDFIIFVPKTNFKMEYFTEIYLTFKSQYPTRSDEYSRELNDLTEKVNIIKGKREQARYEEIYNSAETQIQKATNDLNQQKRIGEKELQKVKKELDLNSNQISLALTQINNGKQELYNQIDSYNSSIESQQTNLNNSYEVYYSTLTSLGLTDANLNETIISLNSSLPLISDPLIYQQTVDKINKLEQLSNSKKELDILQSQLLANQVIVTNQLNNEIEKLIKQEEDLIIQKSKIKQGYQQYYSQKQQLKVKVNTATIEIKDAEKKLNDLDHPKWYILDRTANIGYLGFVQDIDSLGKIGQVFPLLFFVIAILVSLTSMARMVEEQRIQIGTLKALGYNDFRIALKYLIYASLATIIGGSIGMVVGCQLLPKIIWSMYSAMYTIPDFALNFNKYYSYLGLSIILIGILATTVYSCYHELRAMPAVIMRPKPPKSGKKVILEKVTFIWKRLNFTNKVTIRNMFRYKKRFLMTIIGIAGCTALIVTGFGIKDAVSNLLVDQYTDIFKYQMAINIKEDATASELKELKSFLKEKTTKTVDINTFSINATNNDNHQEIQVIVADNITELRKIIKLPGDNITQGSFITEKAAEILKVKSGDEVILKSDDKQKEQIKITAIAENYLNHYVYMNKETYEKLFGKYKTNQLLINYNGLNEEELSKEIINFNATSSVVLLSTFRDNMNRTLESLIYIVGILIISSGILAFVVLYNLSTVNISERSRELATIKVLGFYDNEVHKYLSKETKILTVIGILFGLIIGYYLNKYIVRTCEINIIRFNGHIAWYSFIYAILITISFTVIVDLVNYFVLKKINMIDSLKSIE